MVTRSGSIFGVSLFGGSGCRGGAHSIDGYIEFVDAAVVVNEDVSLYYSGEKNVFVTPTCLGSMGF